MAGEISPLVASLYVAVGGGVGALLRYHVGRVVSNLAGPDAPVPWSTLAVNLIGSLLMGVLIGWLARGHLTPQSSESLRLLAGVGLLGGFTTFSSFSAELVTMLYRGQAGLALGYIAASLVAGLAALYFGIIAAQSGQ